MDGRTRSLPPVSCDENLGGPAVSYAYEPVSLRNNTVEVEDGNERASGRIDATHRCHCQKMFKRHTLMVGACDWHPHQQVWGV